MYLRFVFHLLIISAIIFLRWHLLTGEFGGVRAIIANNVHVILPWAWFIAGYLYFLLHQIFLKPRLDPFGQLELTWTLFFFFFFFFYMYIFFFSLSLSLSLILWKCILNWYLVGGVWMKFERWWSYMELKWRCSREFIWKKRAADFLGRS